MDTAFLRECLLCRTEVARKGLKEHLGQVHGVKLEDAQQFLLQVVKKMVVNNLSNLTGQWPPCVTSFSELREWHEKQ